MSTITESILVVEDDAALREALIDTLRAAGLPALAAADAPAALQLLQSEEIAFFAFLAEIDHAGIIPNVGSIAAKLPKLDVVPMRSFAMLEHEDQFVLAAIERTHSSVALHPDTEVLQLRVNLLACG